MRNSYLLCINSITVPIVSILKTCAGIITCPPTPVFSRIVIKVSQNSMLNAIFSHLFSKKNCDRTTNCPESCHFHIKALCIFTFLASTLSDIPELYFALVSLPFFTFFALDCFRYEKPFHVFKNMFILRGHTC